MDQNRVSLMELCISTQVMETVKKAANDSQVGRYEQDYVVKLAIHFSQLARYSPYVDYLQDVKRRAFTQSLAITALYNPSSFTQSTSPPQVDTTET